MKNILEARITLRERSLPDVIDLALRFVVVEWRAYAKLGALVLVPAFAASWAFASVAGWAWGWLGAMVLAIVAETPFTVLASRLVFSRRVKTSTVLGAALRVMPRLVVVKIGQWLALLASLFTLGFATFWVGPVTLFVGEVVALELGTISSTFGRAHRLANPQFGETFMAWVVLSVIVLLAPFVVDVAGRALLETVLQVRPPLSLLQKGGGELPLLGFWLAVPMCATARFFVYLDVRTRAEGWDIQTRFAALALRTAREEGRA